MPYGTIKVDTITFTAGGVDTSVSISGLVQNPTFTGNITSTGTISGNIIRGGTTVSGATVTGTAGQFGTLTGNTAGFTTVTGATVTGTTANFTSGNFTSISGGTHTITSGVFASGTAAAPSITFTGDLDTGIFNSAANQISITTSGTEWLRVDGTGQIEAVSLGSAAAPTFSFTTDPNTGIYSPGADQVAISTGGSGRLFVNADGSIDFGTTTGSATPTVKAVANPVLSFSNGTNSAYVGLAGVNNRLINFSTNGTTLIQSDSAINLNVVGGSTFTVGTSNTERLRITSAGLVGVGTSSPASTLHIAGTTTSGSVVNALALTQGGSGSGTGTNLYIGYGTTTGTYGSISGFFDGTGTALSFATSPNAGISAVQERLRIDNAGRVGIGTSSPAALLEVRSATTNAARLRVTGTGTTAGNFRGYEFGNGSVFKGGLLQDESTDLISIFTPVGGQSVNITSAGSVGIGTTPAERLHVSGGNVLVQTTAGNNCFIDLAANGAGSQTSSLTIAQQSNGESALFNRANAAMYFATNGTERARIDSSGRLLVGTSSARTNVFRASSSFTAPIQIDSVTNSYSNGINILNYSLSGFSGILTLGMSKSNTQGTNAIVGNNDELGGINFVGNDGTNFRTAVLIEAQVDGVPGAGDMPGRLVFSTTADGASSPTERLRIANNGQLSAVVPGNSTLYPGFMARAWVNFNGTGTVNIRGSGNVSSITDNGVGDYSINYTTAMPDGNYSGITNNDWYGLGYLDSYNTTSVHLVTLENNWTKRDINVISVAIFR